MNRHAWLALVFAFLAAFSNFAQDANQAALLAERREAEERYRRLTSMFEDLRDAYDAQTRRMTQLAQENAELRQELAGKLSNLESRFRASQASAATRDDLKTLTEKLKEVDDKREADKKLILKELKDLANVVASTPPQQQIIIKQDPVPPRRTDQAPIPDATPSAATPANPNGYWTYKVQRGDTLLAIIQAYNAKLKEDKKPLLTLDAIVKANPTVNPNSLRVNQEILIPIPPDK